MRVAVRWGKEKPSRQVLVSLMIGAEMKLAAVVEGDYCYYFVDERLEFAGYDEALPIVTKAISHFQKVSLFGLPEICIDDGTGWKTRDEYIIWLERALKNMNDAAVATIQMIEDLGRG